MLILNTIQNSLLRDLLSKCGLVATQVGNDLRIERANRAELLTEADKREAIALCAACAPTKTVDAHTH